MKSWYMENDMYDKEKIDMINNMKQDIQIWKVEPYLLTWIQYIEKEKVYIMIDNVE